MSDTLQDALARARARASGDSLRSDPPGKAGRIVPFPFPWADTQIAAPNICLRSALFGVVGRHRRRRLTDEILAAVDGFEVRYEGEQLDQYDFDVWAAVLHHQREFGLGGTGAPISLKGIARAVSGAKKVGGSDAARVSASLDRMLKGNVTLRWPGGGFKGHLVSSFSWEDATETRYVISLDARLVELFSRDHYTLLVRDERRALGDRSLAKWLHGFFASHAAPYAYKVETIRDLCGSTASDLFHFRAKLREALDELTERKLIVGYDLDEASDLVSILREPTPVQARHLARK